MNAGRLLPRLATAAGSVVVFLSLAETALRASGFRFVVRDRERELALGGLLAVVETPGGILRRHARRIWTTRPGGASTFGSVSYRINARGFPGPLPLEPRPAGGVRVLCLGDSSTFGLAVSEASAFPRRLEATLGTALPARRVEVVNGGVPGYTIAQGLDRLRELLPSLEPDAVVLMFGAVNEQYPAVRFPDEQWVRLEGADRGGFVAGLRVVQALRWLEVRRGSPRVPRDLGEWLESNPSVLDETGEPVFGRRVSIERFPILLERACALAESSGARPVVVAPALPRPRRFVDPGMRALWRETFYERVGTACRSAGARKGRSLVDLAAIFAERGGEDLFVDDIHPGDAGHALLAESLARVLARLP